MMKSLSEKINHLYGNTSSKKIFIVGTGRSGTHWIAYILESSPEIRATIEARFVFKRVKEIALNPDKLNTLFPNLANYYRLQHFFSAPCHYLDKSHPNIWLAEQLEKTFDDAIFIGMIRNPYATIASMLCHSGVLEWFKKWENYPVPNRFLGIDESNRDKYEDFSLTKKCALRWNAHIAQMMHLEKRLQNKILVIPYESLFHSTNKILDDLSGFIGLSSPLPPPNIKTSSLDKWQNKLTENEVEQIFELTKVSPDEVDNYYSRRAFH